jgi:hypothetical protein
LNTISINYFGEVVAVDDEVTCLYISKESLERIPLYERETMKKWADRRI